MLYELLNFFTLCFYAYTLYEINKVCKRTFVNNLRKMVFWARNFMLFIVVGSVIEFGFGIESDLSIVFQMLYILSSIAVLIMSYYVSKVSGEFGFEHEKGGRIRKVPWKVIIYSVALGAFAYLLSGIVNEYILGFVAALVASLSCYGVSRHKKGDMKHIWMLISVAYGFAALTEALFFVYMLMNDLSIPSYIDLPRMLGYVIILGVVWFIASDLKLNEKRMRRYGRIGVVISTIALLFLNNLQKISMFHSIVMLYVLVSLWISVPVLGFGGMKKWWFLLFSIIFSFASTFVGIKEISVFQRTTPFHSALQMTGFSFGFFGAYYNMARKKLRVKSFIKPVVVFAFFLLVLLSLQFFIFFEVPKELAGKICAYYLAHAVLGVCLLISGINMGIAIPRFTEGDFKAFVKSYVIALFIGFVSVCFEIMEVIFGIDKHIPSFFLLLSSIAVVKSVKKLEKIL